MLRVPCPPHSRPPRGGRRPAVHLLALCAGLVIVAPAASEPGDPVVAVVQPGKTPLPSSATLLSERGETIIDWAITTPGVPHLPFPLAADPSGFERIHFRYRILGSGCRWLGVKMIHAEFTGGDQHVWRAFEGDATPTGWHHADLPLRDPTYIWSTKGQAETRSLSLRAQVKAPAALHIQIDGIWFSRDAFRVGDARLRRREGPVSIWEAAFPVENRSGRPIELAVRAGTVPGTAVRPVATSLRLAPGATAEATFDVELMRTDQAPLTTFCVPITFEMTGVSLSRQEKTLEAATPLPQRSHPCLTLTKAAVGEVREKIRRHPWAQTAYDSLLRRADKALASEPRIPDRQGQWWHFYSCKKCGGRLRTKSPTEHVCRKCGAVYSGEPYDRVPITAQHGRLARQAFELGLAYQLSGELTYAEMAKRILVRYAERYADFPYQDKDGKPGRGGKVTATVLSESGWLIPIAHAYDLVVDSPAMTAQERRAVAEKLLRPAALVCRGKAMGIHNISCWRNAAIGLAALAMDDAELTAYAVTSRSGIRQQIEGGIQDDGVWFENSWGYHYYALGPLCDLAQACHNIGINVFDDRFKSMFDAPLLFAMPDGRLPPFNDGGGASIHSRGTVYEIAWQRWKDPLYAPLLAGDRRGSWQALLYGQPIAGDAAAERPAVSRNFSSSGVLVLRSGADTNGLYLALDYGPHGGGHGHPDKLGFVSCGFGRALAVDPGSIAYAAPLHRQWYKRSLAHNVVVVDQKDQNASTGTLEWFEGGPDAAIAQADAGPIYDGVRHLRTVAMHGGLFVMIDRLISDTPHTYDWVYHNEGTLETGAELRPFEGEIGEPDPYRVPKDIRTANLQGLLRAVWHQDQTALALALRLERPSQVFTATAPGRDPASKVPMLLARQQGKTATFPWAFAIRHADPGPVTIMKLALSVGGKPCADTEAVAVRVQDATGTRLLVVNATGRPVMFEAGSLDGTAVLAVKEPAGYRSVLGVDVRKFTAR
ncbi:MAG: heparinase II/III family protein [Kiritimatiellae bacterium]|nr:heparinase II/III family protein [Kiritimatiellia bacterium]